MPFKTTLIITCFLLSVAVGWELRGVAQPALTAHRRATNLVDTLTFWD